MKTNTKGKLIVGLLAAAVLVTACMPPGGGSTVMDTGGATPVLTLENTAGRGVLVTEDGGRIDIESVEGDTLVRCTEATDILILDSGSSARHAGNRRRRVRALVIGRRDDGLPGIWEVHQDNSIHPVVSSDGAEGTSTAPDCPEFAGMMHGFFGWQYTIMDIVANDDRSEIVATGEASIPGDVRIWRWNVPGPASVGVYWVLQLTESGRYSFKDFAKVIGEPNEKAPLLSDGGKEPNGYAWGWRYLRLIFSSLRLFFLDWYDVYLETVEDDSLQYAGGVIKPIKVVDLVTELEEKLPIGDIKPAIKGGNVYTVLGTSQDGVPSKATIDTGAGVAVEPVTKPELPLPPPPVKDDRIVVQLFDPLDQWAFPLDVAVSLHSTALGSEPPNLGTDLFPVPVGSWTAIEYSAPMPAQAEFIIKVEFTGGSGDLLGPNADDYAIRVVALSAGAPATPESLVTGVTDGDEAGDAPDPWSGGSPVEIHLDEILMRTFSNQVDVDYFKLVLP